MCVCVCVSYLGWISMRSTQRAGLGLVSSDSCAGGGGLADTPLTC